jgi:hypothetical protein
MTAYDQWRKLVPDNLARRQAAWEKYKAIARVRDLGITLREIGENLNTTHEAVRQMELKGRTKQISPVTRWLDAGCYELAELLCERYGYQIRIDNIKETKE